MKYLSTPYQWRHLTRPQVAAFGCPVTVCDNLAMFGVEPIVYLNPELVLPLSEKWIIDKNKWIRRFGVVSLRGYKKVKTSDRVFKTLDMVMGDKDKDIKKRCLGF